jgi:Domain of unknown function (DUF1707)
MGGEDVPADIPPTGEPPERPEPASSPDLRASDADRDRVIDVLRAATADGRLTADEFSERMEAALASRTFRELAPLTADLAAAPARPKPDNAPAEDVLRIDQRGGSVRRTGRWVVPRRLELHPSWCDVNLDFTEAVIRHDTLHVDMKMRGGSLILVTGGGMIVDADSLTTRYADISIHPPTEPDAPDAPVRLRIHLAGRMRYGYIEAR